MNRIDVENREEAFKFPTQRKPRFVGHPGDKDGAGRVWYRVCGRERDSSASQRTLRAGMTDCDFSSGAEARFCFRLAARLKPCPSRVG